MPSKEFSNRYEAVAYLRDELPSNYQQVWDTKDGPDLVEIFFEGITSESLFLSSGVLKEEDTQNNSGYGAYVREYGLIINEKKGALLLAVLLVDILLTQGLAGLVLSQLMQNPIFIRRLANEQHLMCLLGHDAWESLSYVNFKSLLEESACKNPDLSCKFRGKSKQCNISNSDYNDSLSILSDFFDLT